MTFQTRPAGEQTVSKNVNKIVEKTYFVNDQDEIRSSANPDQYFKFFINRNERINNCQRFAFDRAVEEIVHNRLEQEGLQKVRIPFEKPADAAHTPIFVSRDLPRKSRIVVIFGECTKDLGMLAGRVISGPGGINEGSMVSVVQALRGQACSALEDDAPGVILANMGQLWWWPQGNRAITVGASMAIPLPSLVHLGRRHSPKLNNVPCNETPEKHVNYIFNEVLHLLVNENAMIDVVAIGDACEIVQRFLDDAHNWTIWKSQLNAMVLIEPVMDIALLKNDDFKIFLAKRTRGYIGSPDPLNTALASPGGNPFMYLPALGCPCYSSSEQQHLELIFIRARAQALGWLEEVAHTDNYENPTITITLAPEAETVSMDTLWANLADDEKPHIDLVEPEVLRENARIRKECQEFGKPGMISVLDLGNGGSQPSDDQASGGGPGAC
ncbi:hypothetical protein ESCO_004121 [Escovopsis weberi]|uniref:Arb2 domain-containing protein n=1 Tax=Escovopsis weberi TaxID=150374 RepID=A0A0M9VVB4_ESCWE|nr:hypothetical protein ESCO_004121 [Escovopsis weberi]